MDLLDRLQNAQGTRGSWQAVLLIWDAAAITIATFLTYYVRFEGETVPEQFARYILPALVVSLVVYILFAWLYGLYQVVLRHVGIDTLMRVVAAVLSAAVILAALDVIVSAWRSWQRPVPFGVVFIQASLVLLVLGGIRVFLRAAQYLRAIGSHRGAKTLIAGAGSAGSLLLREIHARPGLDVDIIGLIDDDPQLVGTILGGERVLGTITQLEDLVEKHEVTELFVALPTADDSYVRALLNRAADLGLITHIMPKIVVERGSVSLSDMRKVDVEDLLGRELTPIDVAEVRATLEGKVVTITGAAGSIGSELCRQIIVMEPAALHLLEFDESRLYELSFELDAIAPGVAHMHILDIRDKTKVERVFSRIKPQVVLHSAAYKQVPLMEMEPAEALRSNVIGTANIMDAAASHGAERFVLISTDKAVEPVNVMGKTKQLAERLMLARIAEYPEMICVAVRFGNVLGSRGSVVPIFEEMLLRGENLTVTDERVTRFFMLIPEAARLVLQAQAIGASGDIFVLEMGEPVRIVDLARKMIALSGIPVEIDFIGLRPGEKLHEVLINESETLEATSADKIMRVAHSQIEGLNANDMTLITQLAHTDEVTPTQVLAL